MSQQQQHHQRAARARGEPSPSTSTLPARVGSSRLIDRTDYVRLLQQALRGLGYGDAADTLERESVRLCVW